MYSFLYILYLCHDFILFYVICSANNMFYIIFRYSNILLYALPYGFSFSWISPFSAFSDFQVLSHLSWRAQYSSARKAPKRPGECISSIPSLPEAGGD